MGADIMLIDTFKNMLNNRFSDGRDKLRAYVNTDSFIPQKCIVLFYMDEVDIIALGRKTQIGLYNQRVQVAVYHTLHDKAREIAYSVLEYVSTQRVTGLTLSVSTPPTYRGINPVQAQHTFTIEYNMKGDK